MSDFCFWCSWVLSHVLFFLSLTLSVCCLYFLFYFDSILVFFFFPTTTNHFYLCLLSACPYILSHLSVPACWSLCSLVTVFQHFLLFLFHPRPDLVFHFSLLLFSHGLFSFLYFRSWQCFWFLYSIHHGLLLLPLTPEFGSLPDFLKEWTSHKMDPARDMDILWGYSHWEVEENLWLMDYVPRVDYSQYMGTCLERGAPKRGKCSAPRPPHFQGKIAPKLVQESSRRRRSRKSHCSRCPLFPWWSQTHPTLYSAVIPSSCFCAVWRCTTSCSDLFCSYFSLIGLCPRLFGF